MQVYTAFYVATAQDKPVHILVVRKRLRGYFFGQKPPLRAGSKIKNGGGKYAFPGGAKDLQDKGKGLILAALREWNEETGVDMSAHANKFFEPVKVKDYGIINANLAEDDSIRIDEKTGLEALKALRDKINVNLAEAGNAANDVMNGVIDTWQGVKTAYPHCPESNELEIAEIWDTTTNAAEITAWGKDTDTDWFHAFLRKQFPDHVE